MVHGLTEQPVFFILCGRSLLCSFNLAVVNHLCRNADGQMLPGTGLKNTQFSGVGNEHTSHLCTGNSPVYATDCFLEEFRDMLSPHHGNNAANFRNGHDTTEAINKTAAATAIVVLLGLLGQTRKENFVEIINIGSKQRGIAITDHLVKITADVGQEALVVIAIPLVDFVNQSSDSLHNDFSFVFSVFLDLYLYQRANLWFIQVKRKFLG